MKAVLLSIKPKYCGLIASGKKTVEVRKTKPNLDMPFKCYIYCTKDRKLNFWTGKRYSYSDEQSHNLFDKCGNGKVIGEFICNKMEVFTANYRTAHLVHTERIAHSACIPMFDLIEYGMNNRLLYGWHISDLVIYDKPKELSEFQQCHKCKHTCLKTEQNKDLCQYHRLTRPPQSWCYVESEVSE